MAAMLKYPLNVGMNVLQLPAFTDLTNATVQHQPGQTHPIQMWVLADPSYPQAEDVHIYVALTGESLPLAPNQAYHNLGTVQLNGGGFVVHALLLKDA